MGVAIFGFKKSLLKVSIQGKTCRSALRYTQVYFQAWDLPQLLENYTLRFDARREKYK